MLKNLSIILFSVLLFTYSCINSDRKRIKFSNDNLEFQLLSGENIIDKNIEIVEKYDSLFNNNESFQNPLLNYINHKDYEIFIGLPISSSARLISNYKLKDIDTSNCNFIFENNTLFISFQNDSLYFSEYIREFKDNYLVSVSTISNNDTVFSKDNIDSRFIIKK
jgi:hypothetical protein